MESSQRYEIFKSFKTTVPPKKGDAIKISSNLYLTYGYGRMTGDEFILGREMNFNRNRVIIVLSESGKRIVKVNGDYLVITEIKDGHYIVNSDQSFIDFCMKNEIITFSSSLPRKHTFQKSTYSVVFNKSLRLDFSDIPEDLTRYFKKTYQEETHFQTIGMMFVDLDLETI